MTIIRAGPRLFENLARRARVKERPGGNATRYLTRTIDVGGFEGSCIFRDSDTGNTCFHFDALPQNVLKRLAALRGDAASKPFSFGWQGDCQ
jgi:hypothetical protein